MTEKKALAGWAAVAAKPKPPAPKPAPKPVKTPEPAPEPVPTSKALVAHMTDYEQQLARAKAAVEKYQRDIKTVEEVHVPQRRKELADEIAKREAFNKEVKEAENKAYAYKQTPEYKRLLADLCRLCKQVGLRSYRCDCREGKSAYEFREENKYWVLPAEIVSIEGRITELQKQGDAAVAEFYKVNRYCPNWYGYQLDSNVSNARIQLRYQDEVIGKLWDKVYEYEHDVQRLEKLVADQSVALKVLQLPVEPTPEAEVLVRIPLAHLREMLKLLKL
ncbi:Hypothetical protein POVN_LOCUS288 [uncultured virus]|nr:Hypothetical protein POVN_LOCUS288 [uncultured virus]